jgi:hypothetical protein
MEVLSDIVICRRYEFKQHMYKQARLRRARRTLSFPICIVALSQGGVIWSMAVGVAWRGDKIRRYVKVDNRAGSGEGLHPL